MSKQHTLPPTNLPANNTQLATLPLNNPNNTPLPPLRHPPLNPPLHLGPRRRTPDIHRRNHLLDPQRADEHSQFPEARVLRVRDAEAGGLARAAALRYEFRHAVGGLPVWAVEDGLD